MLQKISQKLIAPKAGDEDGRRREYILNILLLGAILLSFVAFGIVAFDIALSGRGYSDESLVIVLGALLIFILLFAVSRFGFSRIAAYLFVLIFFLLATYPLSVWGIQLPQGILMYSLVIVMAGVLLGARLAFVVAVFAAGALFAITYLQEGGILHRDREWINQPGNYGDVATFLATFLLVALVSWLSNREVEKSLRRARISEAALLKERNSLQVKVEERTRELQQAQIEKMLELHRFAEFGRLSAGLLHDLANPLALVSLNLEQMGEKQQSNLVRQARKAVSHMEEYLAAARRQVQNQREVTLFEIGPELRQIIGLLKSKAKAQGVHIESQVVRGLHIRGDSIQFHHIMANLIANAIDACDISEAKHQKQVVVIAKKTATYIEITVCDNGIGIKPSELPRIFEAFYTTKARERGTGLGLAIVKQTVEEDFNGTITATSDKRSGTCFTVTFALKS